MKKFGRVCIIGEPNAGKSTLINYLVGQKIAAVSHKAQTTRFMTEGIIIHNDMQAVLIDTPGIFKGSLKTDRLLVKEAWNAHSICDLAVVLIDPFRKDLSYIEEIIQRASETKWCMVINKIDLVKPVHVLPIIEALKKYNPEQVFIISAKNGDGVEELLSYISSVLPEMPWAYPQEQLSTMPAQIIACEITREQIFNTFEKEIPYATNVAPCHWIKKKNGIHIYQNIIISKKSQKAIMLGKKGEMIKKISIDSRKIMQDTFNDSVHLFLFVKRDTAWRQKWLTHGLTKDV